MVRIIAIASGKGGVGKTTIAANLSLVLQKLGKRVVVIDCNLTTAHLGLLFGIYFYPKTLNDFLRDEVRFENILYRHVSGLRIVPASLNLDDLAGIEVGDLKTSLKTAFSDYDLVILDSAPGLGREALISLQAADEILFVATPTIPSLVDIVKCKSVVGALGGGANVLGIVINRVKNREYEITPEDVRRFTELPVVGIIPEDENVIESANRRSLVVISNQNSPASQAILRIGVRLAGSPGFMSIPEKFYKRPGFFRRVLNRFMPKG